MSKAELEADAAAATRAVDECKRTVAGIETQANAATLALARAKKAREQHALAGAMSDAGAVAAIKQARAEQMAAEQIIGDLDLALPGARASLAAAEKAADAARRTLAQFIADSLKREVIEEDAQIDILIADLTCRLEKRARLISEIINLDVLPRTMHGITSGYEEAMGMRRVAAAMYAVMSKIYPNMPRDEQTQKLLLAVGDRRYWFGDKPVETTTTTKAA